MPSEKIKKLCNVRAGYFGYLFRNGVLLPESFSDITTFHSWKLRSKVKQAALVYLAPKLEYVEAGFWVTDDWSVGYFHWFADVIPKIIIARSLNLNHEIFLPGVLEQNRFVYDSIGYLRESKIRFVEKFTSVKFKHLFLPVHSKISGEFDVEIIRKLRTLFIPAEVSDRKPSKKIYISRRQAQRRRVLNETELEKLLLKYDFEIHETDNMSLDEQIALFSNCSVLFLLHGAGLTNMLFMPDSSTVIELRTNSGYLPNCFFNLANAIGHHHIIVECNSAAPNMSANLADVSVNIDRIRKVLDNNAL